MAGIPSFGGPFRYDIKPPEIVGPTDILQAQGIQEQNALRGLAVQEQQRVIEGRNALAQLYQDPINRTPDGLLNSNALSQLGSRYPEVAQAQIASQAKLAEQRTLMETQKANAARANVMSIYYGNKVTDDQRKQLSNLAAGLDSEYEKLVKQYGEQRANELMNAGPYAKATEMVKQSGFPDGLTRQWSNTFDPYSNKAILWAGDGMKQWESGQKEDKSPNAVAKYTDNQGLMYRPSKNGLEVFDPADKSWKVVGQAPADLRPLNVMSADLAGARASAVATATAKARSDAAGTEGQLTPQTLEFNARQIWTGDKSPMQNIGRGTQGAKNLAALRNKVTEIGIAEHRSPEELAAKIAEFSGIMAGERTLGTRQANVDMAVTEAKNLIPLALKASDDLKRTGIKSVNDLIQYAQDKTASPALRRLAGATNALVNVYARAINPNGIPTDNDRAHARKILDNGFANGDYAAAADQLRLEMEQAQISPGQVRKDLRETITGGAGGSSTPKRMTLDEYLGGEPEIMEVRMPDGSVIANVPDGTTKADLVGRLQRNGKQVPEEWLADSSVYRFSPDSIAKYKDDPNAKVVYMAPADYLRLSPELTNANDAKGRSLQASLAAGDAVDAIPTFSVKDGRIAAQDGRHRALEAQKAGLDKIPVAIIGDLRDTSELTGMDGKEKIPLAKIGVPLTKRTAMEQIPRQLGLTVRHGLEGLAQTAGIFTDPFVRLAGGKPMAEVTGQLLDAAGVPRQGNDLESFVGSVSRAGTGAGGLAGAARAIPAALSAAPALINNLLAQAPAAQMAQAGIGAGASEALRQAGAPEWAQLAGGAVAPIAASGVANVAAGVGRGLNELRRPLTQAGAEQVAADVLGRVTSDKLTSKENLARYLAYKENQARGGPQVGVPGVEPTTAMVAGDYGIAGASQMAERGVGTPAFYERYAKNNAALADDLGRLRASRDQLAEYAKRRDEITTPMREHVFANATGTVNYDKVAEEVAAAAATPAGGRVESDKALTWLTKRLDDYANKGRNDPANAYALYQDIGDLVAGKVVDSNGAALRLAGGIANSVKKELGRQIEEAAPGFKDYLRTYSRLSKPIDRLEIIHSKLGDDLQKVTTSMPMATAEGGRYTVSADKVRRAKDAIESALADEKNIPGLAPYQQNVLSRVLGTLNAKTFAQGGGKPPGSDTYQNMATANFLRGVFGDELAKSGLGGTVTGAVNMLSKRFGTEERINNALAQAFLDPSKAYDLLRIARTSRSSPTVFDIANSAGGGAGMGLLGSVLNQ